MRGHKDNPLDRREFFRHGLKKAAEIAVDAAETSAAARARHWIRPPFALDELDFLLQCTRCGDCVEACPTGVIFPLSGKYGVTAVETPAMDLANKACLMCDDWPCVTACEPGALLRPPAPETEEGEDAHAADISLPRLATAKIDTASCLPYLGPECGACNNACPVPGALLWDGPRPRIDPEICTGCGACRVACITEPKSVLISPLTREK